MVLAQPNPAVDAKLTRAASKRKLADTEYAQVLAVESGSVAKASSSRRSALKKTKTEAVLVKGSENGETALEPARSRRGRKPAKPSTGVVEPIPEVTPKGRREAKKQELVGKAKGKTSTLRN